MKVDLSQNRPLTAKTNKSSRRYIGDENLVDDFDALNFISINREDKNAKDESLVCVSEKSEFGRLPDLDQINEHSENSYNNCKGDLRKCSTNPNLHKKLTDTKLMKVKSL